MSHKSRSFMFVLLGLLALMTPLVMMPALAAPPPPDADERVYPPILLPNGAPDSPAPPAQPREPSANLPWSRLVYYAYNNDNWDIYISADDGQNLRQLTSGKQLDAQPDLNRGGTRIVYVSDVDGDTDLYTMSADGSNQALLLDTPAEEAMPVWSPDGTRIAFQSDRDGQSEVYVINANGSGLTRLTHNPDFDGHPTWSPDGTRIAYSSRRHGQYRIWSMDARDGSGEKQLSAQPGSLYPTWSLEGLIAYSGDANNDGWLDLWLMNGDGSQQRELRSGFGMTHDYMPRSWAPDGSQVAYTLVNYVYYQGEWRIYDATMWRINTSHQGYDLLPTDRQYAFSPDWETLDNQTPVSAIEPIPPVSPNPIVVRWSASDRGPAGLKRVQIQISVDGGPWVDWLDETTGGQAQYSEGHGGHTYAFRSRAFDHSLNSESWPAAPDAVTTVESLPPQTTVTPLPVFSRYDQDFQLAWSAVDPGNSGVLGYLMQWRRGNGAWTEWPNTLSETSFIFDPAAQGAQPGDTVAFRLSGTDRAHNVEAWPPDPGHTLTTLYRWGISGRVVDNTGTPVAGATVGTDPATQGPALSGADGDYGRYLIATANSVGVDWAKPGYGALPLTGFATGNDAHLLVALPPADDATGDGDFEAGWGEWQPGGTLTPTLATSARHTGATGALLAERPPVFGAPHQVTNSPTTADLNVRLHLAGGKTTLVWSRGSENSDLVAMQRGPDGTWSPVRTLFTPSVYGFDTVTGSDGLVHVVASRTGGMRYSRQNSDGTWSAAEVVPSSPLTQELKLVRGPGDVLHLFWHEWIDRGGLIRYSRRTPGVGWSQPTIVGEIVEGTLRHFDATVTANGAVQLLYLVTFSDDAQGDQLLARERRPNGSWTSPELLMKAERLELFWNSDPVADAAGRAYFMWAYNQHLISEVRTYAYYSLNSGDGWAEPRLVMDNAVPAHLAVAPNGTVAALLGQNNELVYSELGANGIWSFPQPVPLEQVSSVEMIIDDDGSAHILTDGYFNTYYFKLPVTYIHRSAAGTWSEPVEVSDNEINNHGASMALDAGGNPHVAWLMEEGDGYNIADVVYAGPTIGAAGETILSRVVTVPAGATHPVLSFFYTLGGAMGSGTKLELVVEGAGNERSAVALPISPATMRQYWADLSAYAGETVTVTLRLQQAAGWPAAWAAVDDVSLGEAHGDVWLTGRGGSALPGETVVHELTVSNRGGVAADDVIVTYSLPPELVFASADPAPENSQPLRWNLGSLEPGETRTLRVVATVKDSAEPFKTVIGAAAVSAVGELETHNNAADIPTWLVRGVFLPTSMR